MRPLHSALIVFALVAGWVACQPSGEKLVAVDQVTFDASKTKDKQEWSLQAGNTDLVSLQSGGAKFSVPASGDKATAYYRSDAIQTWSAEGYLKVSLDAAGSLDLPKAPSANWWDQSGVSVTVAQLTGPTWTMVCGLALFANTTGALKGALRWTDATGGWRFDAVSFDMPSSGSHEIVLGYVIDSFIEMWIDGSLVRHKAVNHTEPYSYLASCGLVSVGSSVKRSSGSFTVKSCSMQLPFVSDLYVSATSGSDSNDGLASARPLKTISTAAHKTVPGTTVHIADGIYRESITKVPSGKSGQEISYVASGNAAYLVGSVNAAILNWKKNTNLGTNVWEADTSAFAAYWSDSPRYFVELNPDFSNVNRFHIARYPNYQVDQIYRFTEFWEVAEGGSSIPSCYPANNSDQSCDYNTRSPTQMIDYSFDKISDPVGARIYVSDCNSGHYIYKRQVKSRDKAAHKIVVDEECLFDGLYPTLGLYSAWYMENKLEFLDLDGEYFYDSVAHKMYLKYSGSDFTKLEVSLTNNTRFTGIDLSLVSYVNIVGLQFRLFEQYAVSENGGWSSSLHGSSHVHIKNVDIQYCNIGLYISHGCASEDNYLQYWYLTGSKIGYIDSHAINMYNPATPSPRVGVRNVYIQGNDFHDLGFNCDDENRVGAAFGNPKYLYILDNTISRVSHNGFQISYSAADGNDIYTGQVLVRGNKWNQPCCSNADCGCLKFWSPNEAHKWKDVLVVDNICQNSFGWTRPSYNRQLWAHGYGGFGWYTDHVSGVSLFRNVAYNNADVGITMYMLWEDEANYIYNNLLIGSPYGFSLGGKTQDQTTTTDIKNNVFLDMEEYSFSVSANDGTIEPDHIQLNDNLYWHSGWGQV
eukprot:TRINITY_DN3335_c0_g1_i1.p1 TRINITY_DN3335_c0_g1~~TRINITY_DN3335_c0_g1_i1.p1  ORF type:complete len:865 (+),score=143.04 TRINITY_DN3335_c0_g1_i1:3-2597(+)